MAPSRSSIPRTVGLLALAPLAVGLALAFGPDPRRLAERGLVSRALDYEGSVACRACHPDQHESWARTFHSTMTQLPTRERVLGRFDARPVEFYRQSAMPFERDGRFFMSLPATPEAPAREAEVALCVGSRRYQQYFERLGPEAGDAYRRLPILWHVGEERWMHLNGVFLEPDDPSWSAHASLWNENCIFCHNTAPAPRMKLDSNAGAALPKSFDSRVGELGIACESCHGPGEAHVAKHASPLARYATHLAGERDYSIVHPEKLAQAESLAVCGQCHSQRMPSPSEKLWTFLDSGPTFRPGDELAEHVEPITCETPSPSAHDPELFRARFWRDGTARLTAYEYLGITQSPCVEGGEMTCGSCHAMHGGDVHGQLEPRMRGDEACTQCHAEIASDLGAHTHHDPGSSGSRCLDCHMPRIVYGIVDVHRSHRIESPDVRRDVEAGRPNACTACHLAQSALWAADRMLEWWGEEYERPRSRPDGAALELPEAIASLHAGDAVQRAVYAYHFGRPDSAVETRERAFVFTHLAVALGDGYPSIRTLARRSLRGLDEQVGLGLAEEIEDFDTFAPPAERQRRVLSLLESVRNASGSRFAAPALDTLLAQDFELDLERVRALLELQDDHVISIGE